MITNQTIIDSDTVFKQIITELWRRRTLPWHCLTFYVAPVYTCISEYVYVCLFVCTHFLNDGYVYLVSSMYFFVWVHLYVFILVSSIKFLKKEKGRWQFQVVGEHALTTMLKHQTASTELSTLKSQDFNINPCNATLLCIIQALIWSRRSSNLC